MRRTVLISVGVLLVLMLATGVHANPAPPDSTGSVSSVPAALAGQSSPPLFDPAPPLPPAEGPVQWSTDFSSADLSAWMARPILPGDQPASWRVMDGRLQQDGTLYREPRDEAAVLLGPSAGTAFQWEAALLPQGGDTIGLVWGADGTGYNRALFYLHSTRSPAISAVVEQVRDGRVTRRAVVAATTWPGWTNRAWFRAGVRVAGSRLTVLADGQPILTLDGAGAAGRVGVYAQALGYAAFDNVRLQQPTTALPIGPAAAQAPGQPAAPIRDPNAPLYDDWSSPVNISGSIGNSSGPGGVSGLSNGRAFAAWTEFVSDDSHYEVAVNWNDYLNGPFQGPASLDTTTGTSDQVVNVRQTKDNQDRVHIIWARQNSDGSADIYYARREASGAISILQPIPVTNSPPGTPRKVDDIVVDSAGVIHVVWGRDGESLFYTESTDGVNWSAPSTLPWVSGVSGPSIGVTNSNQVFVAWIDRSIDPNGDVFVAQRSGNGWTQPSDVSQGVGGVAHSPTLAGDLGGKMRLAWDDEGSGFAPTRNNNDIYTRDWTNGSWGAVVRAVVNSGDSLGPQITVDAVNISHLSWSDNTSSDNDFRVWYARGRVGTGYIAYSMVPFTGDEYSKDTGIDAGGGGIHLTYSMVIGGVKDRYYTVSSEPPPPPPPTNTPINTPTWTPSNTPTNTPTRTPSNTPTATATLCPGTQFVDLCPSSPFYVYVTDLVSRGAISGYGCGSQGEPCYPGNVPYFRPFANITRAQVCKVALAAFSIAVGATTQVFEDVPPSNGLFNQVNTAYNRGIISGYTCGGPNEPCVAPGNRPYFRPGNNVGRGQIAKIVTLARGWVFTPPTTPTFEDVPTTSPFYSYIETMYAAGVISGYGCGGPGEPCVAPGNRPYYRPANQITRAQASKVIDLAITHAPPAPPSVTRTATRVPSATPTRPPSNTATPVLSSTPIATPTRTRTATPALSATASRTATLAVSATSTQTITPALSPTRTTSPTLTATLTRTAAPGPVILTVVPDHVEQYDSVTEIDLGGQNFGLQGPNSRVVVNGVNATIETWSNTLIAFHITRNTPPGSNTQVIRDDGLSASTNLLMVDARYHPIIFGYAPAQVCVGDISATIVATGTNFGIITGTITLAGAYPATIVSWSDQQINFHIAADTPPVAPVFVQVVSPQNGTYKEYGGLSIVDCSSPTPGGATATVMVPTTTRTTTPGGATATPGGATATTTRTTTPGGATSTPGGATATTTRTTTPGGATSTPTQLASTVTTTATRTATATITALCQSTAYYSTDVPKTIPNLTTITSTLTINNGPIIGVIDVIGIDLTHFYASDLSAHLISPQGTRVELFVAVCGSQVWFTGNTGFTLSQSGGSVIGTTCPPGPGIYRPSGTLAPLSGQSATGTWSLEITDGRAGNSGTLNAWGLRITPLQCLNRGGKP